MFSRAILIAVMVAGIGFVSKAIAAADGYTFEPVEAELQKGDVIVAVRLLQKPTSKPVADAVIVRTRIDMAPDGMPTMESPLTPEPSEPGVYRFKTNLPMGGRWLLSIAAKVQGKPETVVGKITYTVTP
jgi:YtkA-like